MTPTADADDRSFDVPCNGCMRCCRGDAIRILPGEDPARWQTEPHARFAGARMLAHKANGDCVYLGEHGCTIHEQKPRMCREMDCRNLARAMSWTLARTLEKRGMFRIEIWRRGRELLKLTDER